MPLALDDASTLGQDRVLCAVGAYARSQQACVVVDAGTAITVEFVDGQGVFQGVVIAPGVSMMLGAMHAGTAQLPEVRLEPPDPSRGPFGKDTRHAMLLGVIAAARGLVRETVERYAEHYQAYPQIVATGGDAALLFDGSDLVEHIVPDLQLLGILEVWERAMRDSEEVEAGDDDQ
jgi:type III pantothenate kinase